MLEEIPTDATPRRRRYLEGINKKRMRTFLVKKVAVRDLRALHDGQDDCGPGTMGELLAAVDGAATEMQHASSVAVPVTTADEVPGVAPLAEALADVAERFQLAARLQVQSATRSTGRSGSHS